MVIVRVNYIREWLLVRIWVLWGRNLGSGVGRGRLTKVERSMIKLAPFQFSVIIGLLLSDGWLTLASEKSLNARLGFKQSLAQSTYVLFVFNILSHYCSNSPQITTSVRSSLTSLEGGDLVNDITVYNSLLEHYLALPHCILCFILKKLKLYQKIFTIY